MKLRVRKNYYFRKDSKRFIVRKKLDGTNRYFGSFRTEEQAQRAVELFDEYGWDLETRWRVREQVAEELGV